jgi:hypothetical protein
LNYEKCFDVLTIFCMLFKLEFHYKSMSKGPFAFAAGKCGPPAYLLDGVTYDLVCLADPGKLRRMDRQEASR